MRRGGSRLGGRGVEAGGGCQLNRERAGAHGSVGPWLADPALIRNIC
jgi:hypothetical protein